LLPIAMKRALSTFISLRKARGGVSALLLTVLVALQSMVASPALHRLVHIDAASPAHQCAVTMLASGHVDCVDPVISIFSPESILVLEARPPGVDFVSTDIQLQPNRGPPAGSVLLG